MYFFFYYFCSFCFQHQILHDRSPCLGLVTLLSQVSVQVPMYILSLESSNLRFNKIVGLHVINNRPLIMLWIKERKGNPIEKKKFEEVRKSYLGSPIGRIFIRSSLNSLLFFHLCFQWKFPLLFIIVDALNQCFPLCEDSFGLPTVMTPKARCLLWMSKDYIHRWVSSQLPVNVYVS